MSEPITMRDMLAAGVHFGHQTRYWNPKMKQYIFGDRHKTHIINLEITMQKFHDALNFIGKVASKRGKILFVGTKNSAHDAIAEEATRAGMPYVNHRWLGGMLTNYKTVRQSIKRLKDIEKAAEEGSFDRMIKKEALQKTRDLKKLNRSFGGIKNMNGLPDVLFVIDSTHEKIAILEAQRLGIPVIAIVDTNGMIEGVDYLIPGNDDAIRAIRLYLRGVADAIIDARKAAQINAEDEESEEGSGKRSDKSHVVKKKAVKAIEEPVVVSEPVVAEAVKEEQKPAKKIIAKPSAPKTAKKVEAVAEEKPAVKNSATKKKAAE